MQSVVASSRSSSFRSLISHVRRNSNFYPATCTYNEVFRKSIDSCEEFWAEQGEQLQWFKKWDRVLKDGTTPHPKWFHGGLMNTTYNCLDRHLESGFGGQIAIIHDSPVSGTKQTWTYKTLLDKVSRFAGLLSRCGVTKGDRVLIYMPMIPETMVAMLAAARLGAIHSVVFGGFAARELANRISHAEPKVVIGANCGLEPNKVIDYKTILDEAIRLSTSKPAKCIIYNRPGQPAAKLDRSRDIEWEESLAAAKPHDPVPVEANEPIYLLYTSGTTGLPKGVVRPSGGHAVALKWSMKNIYNVNPGEAWWASSDFGWVVGHSYICYAPLLHRATTIIYEGKPVGTPDPAQYFRVLSEHGPVSLFTTPSAMRAIRREDPHLKFGSRYRTPNLRSVFLAGEHCDPETIQWTRQTFRGMPIIDHWWQTETGWAITATCLGLGDLEEPPAGSAGRPVPGYDVEIVERGENDPGHHHHHHGDDPDLGRIVVKLPLPPGMAYTLWKNDEKFHELYFTKYPGFYDTMDAGRITEDNHIFVMSRDDDVLNVAGHRLSSGAIEEACLENLDLAECAVVGVADKLKGEIPLGLLVPDSEVKKGPEVIIKETCNIVREKIGPVASFKLAIVVNKLPKTRSGKVARGTIAAMAAGKPFKIPVTIEDPTVYGPIYDALKVLGMQPSHPEE